MKKKISSLSPTDIRVQFLSNLLETGARKPIDLEKDKQYWQERNSYYGAILWLKAINIVLENYDANNQL